ncbi:flagellar filament capping protein FliD [Sulfurimonas sp.]|uniref:flagellar filament capping protein FliD n=1 Tax=Sulfurimonas sp. TaxID=2022749 RepID=UPI0025CBE265|nr:flagellar filament capping protein FliD [Sulfurimonas sp.]
MGISSLGVGSSILTQDVLDQLKSADESKFVAPVEARLKSENAKLQSFQVLEAHMDAVGQSLNPLTGYGIFESRITSASDDKVVDISASKNSDVQDFTLDVTSLATKQISQSASFSAKTSTIATADGSMDLSIGKEKFTLDYKSTTTLNDFKDMINKEAGDTLKASIVQIAKNDFRLFLISERTGTGQEISIVDNTVIKETLKPEEKLDKEVKLDKDGNPIEDEKILKAGNLNVSLTTGIQSVQNAVDATFKFNGLEITRSSNMINDLANGLTITLQDLGTSSVSVRQDRETIETSIVNFIDKYNSTLFQLNEDTRSSQDKSTRGVFSSNSTIRGMESAIINVFSTIGEGAGRIQDYGIEADKSGRLSFNASKLNKMLDADPDNVKAFLAGGEFTRIDGSKTELKGAFSEVEEEINKYSKYNAILDQFKNSINTRVDSLDEQKEKAIQRLEDRYEIMGKRFSAYDGVISKFNNASNMFGQMISTEAATN